MLYVIAGFLPFQEGGLLLLLLDVQLDELLHRVCRLLFLHDFLPLFLTLNFVKRLNLVDQVHREQGQPIVLSQLTRLVCVEKAWTYLQHFKCFLIELQ